MSAGLMGSSWSCIWVTSEEGHHGEVGRSVREGNKVQYKSGVKEPDAINGKGEEKGKSGALPN
jgi:hypothetical protein